MKHFLQNRIHQIGITLIWLLAVILVNPFGEFPINDDWAYALNVHNIGINGEFKLSPWPAMTLISQSFWGAFLVKIFGFSFTLLRISTLVLSLVATLLSYRFVQLTTNQLPLAFASALIVAFNPIYFSLSFTFMTEVYFLVCFITALLFFHRYFLSSVNRYLVLAISFSLLALLIRQTGIILPIAFATILFFTERGFVKRIVIAGIPLLLALLTLVAYKQLRLATGNTNGSYSSFGALFVTLKNFDLSHIIARVGSILLYIGLLLMPLSILLLVSTRTGFSRFKWITLLLFGGLALFCMSTVWNTFPNGNIFNNLGLGPKLLTDTQWGEHIYPRVTANSWKFIYFLSACSVIVLIVKATPISIATMRKPVLWSARQKIMAMIAVCILGLAGYLLLNPNFFDRYTLPLTVLLGLLIPIYLAKQINKVRWFSFVPIGLLALLCILLTRDYFSWQRARWTAIETLVDEFKVQPDQIDGGFEYNGWTQKGIQGAVHNDRMKKSWWVNGTDEFVVAAGFIPGFRCIDTISYSTTIPWGTHDLYVFWHPLNDHVDYGIFPFVCEFDQTSIDGQRLLTSNEFVVFHSKATLSDEIAFAEKSIELSPELPFGPTYEFKPLVAGDQLRISVLRKIGTAGKLILCSDDINELYLTATSGTPLLGNQWEQLSLHYIVPQEMDGKTVKTYFWNDGHEKSYFDQWLINRLPADTANVH